MVGLDVGAGAQRGMGSASAGAAFPPAGRFRMLIPHETKRSETWEARTVREGFSLTREIYENKPLRQDSRERRGAFGIVMLLKNNGLFSWLGGEEGEKKGAPK